ncbi:MFS general substrate transporter [Amylostereum chailletii]|nr:MFS general substrate transporter [Amylostereum chailletii]
MSMKTIHEDKAIVTNDLLAVDLPSQRIPHRKDGGVRAWCSVVGGWLVMFCSFGYGNAFGVFQDLYTRQGGVSSSAASWIGSVQAFLMMVLALPAGQLIDMGYARHVVICGSAMYFLCLFLLSFAHVGSYYQLFLAQGIGMGLSGGFLYLPAMALQARHWERRRALAMGIVSSGSSIGGAVFPIMLNQLLHHNNLGFGWTTRALAFVILGLLIVANVLMSPGEAGPRSALRTGGVRKMLKDMPIVVVTLGSFLVNCGYYFPLFYVQLYCILHGINSNVAFYMLTIMNASSTVGRVVPSWSSDHFGVFSNYVPACLISSVLLFAMLATTSIPGIVVFSVLYGFASGAVITLLAPLVATLTSDPSEMGLRIGASFSVVSFAYLVGSPAAGALLGSGNTHWWRAIIFSAIPVVVGSFMLIPIWVRVARREKTWRV